MSNPKSPTPLAIIGFAAKFSQEATNVENFWDFLLQARQSMTTFPKDRLSLEGYYHPDPERAGTIHSKGAHFLSEPPSAFDAAFFSVNKIEVKGLDPQQCLVMENVYHALENAGIPMQKAVSSNTSVFVSGFNHDHRDRLRTDPEIFFKHSPTSSESSMISGRVSWFYDFKGPSITVDTACSSSMVALHLANQSILSGDSDMAIISGVSVFGGLGHMQGMSYSGFLGSEGKCFTFDHRADGYSRGEGVGTVIVKSLDKALADGDTIRAVIRGTALNHDGRTPGLTYPSGDAQERLVRNIYESVGLDPTETLYVESHGTGTPAGDPIEVHAIARAFGSVNREQPIYVGALKPNIGHTEGGSGISGIIKAVLILESGIIPSNVNFEEVNPEIRMEEWKVRFPMTAIPWPASGLRRVSVNCFGLSGTNAHCILDDAYHFLRNQALVGNHNTRPGTPTVEDVARLVNPDVIHAELSDIQQEDTSPTGTEAPKLFLFSGFDQNAPKRISTELLNYIKRHEHSSTKSDPAQTLLDTAFTLSERRSRFRWSSYLLAGSTKDLEAQLESDSGLPEPISAQKSSRVGFVFTGQGAQYARMGHQLLQFSVFRESLDAATEYLKSHGCQWSIIDEIFREKTESNIDEAAKSHPCCTVLQVALVDLLHSWNIRPVSVVGHSSGEIAAAYCAGKISREAAWHVAYYRGRVTSHIPRKPRGAMLAVGLDCVTLQPYLDQIHDKVSGDLVIACFNSPKNNTVSGDESMIVALQSVLEGEGAFVRRLRAPNAYHSPHMLEIADDYLEAMGQVPDGYYLAQDEPVRMFSTSTGSEVTEDRLQSEYWVRNLVSTVKFTTALQAMCTFRDGAAPDQLLEVGPHCALQSAAKESLTGQKSIVYRATLDRKDGSTKTLLHTVGALAIRGIPVNLRTVNLSCESARVPTLLVDLPPYPFNHHENALYESRITRAVRFRALPRHDLLGALSPDSSPLQWSWKHFLRVTENPWLKDHVVAENIVFPGAGYIVMAIEATRQIMSSAPLSGLHIRDVSFKSMLIIPNNNDGVETCFSLTPMDESNVSTSSLWNKFTVSSYDFDHDEWTENCTGYISVELKSTPSPVTGGRENAYRLETWSLAQEQADQCRRPMDFIRMCDNLDSVGITFGPLFRNLSDVRIGGQGTGVMAGTINIPDVAAVMPKGYTHPHLIHPATLDATLQAGIAAICDFTGHRQLRRGNVPGFIKDMWISASIPNQGSLECCGNASLLSHNAYNFDGRVWDREGKSGLITLTGVHLMPFQSNTGNSYETQLFHSIEWSADANFLSNSTLGRSTPDQTKYESEKLWFSEIQLAAALLATDALTDLKTYQFPASTPDHLLKFYESLKRVVADVVTGSIGYITFEDWQKCVHDVALKRELYTRVASRDTHGEVLVRMGYSIASFLQQNSDPLYVMFGQDDLMTRYYDGDMDMGPIPQEMAKMMSSMRFTFSNLKILEIGAGTGGFTSHILKYLRPLNADGETEGNCIASYDFTDVSPSFFESAKARFSDWGSILNYRKLDLSLDPISQGFAAASYDMIVASNVLHATPSIQQTLMNMQLLLRPGGKLLFLEGVRQDTIYTNISFGALPGWWLGQEPIRKWCPYITEKEWDVRLRGSGFSGVDLSITSSYYPDFKNFSIMLSTTVQPRGTAACPRVVIISTESESGSVASMLQEYLKDEMNIPFCSLLHPRELVETELDQVVCISLLELSSPILSDMDEASFAQVKHLLLACNQIIWVTGVEDPKQNMAAGLIRTIRWERDSHDLDLVTVAVDPRGSLTNETVHNLSKILQHHFLDASEGKVHANAEYRLVGGQIQTNRVVDNIHATEVISSHSVEPIPVPSEWKEVERPIKLQIGQQGDLNSLHWVTDGDKPRPLGPAEVEIEVHAVGLNFRDLLAVMGELPRATIGNEAAGVVTRLGSGVSRFHVGDRVAYISDPDYPGTLRTLGRADQGLVMPIPDEFGFEQAASMPIIYATVIYSLKHIARLLEGESILIHAGAGGVGQAAIQYARFVGAEVFTTVSTLEKKQLLMKEYGIPEDHIFSSRGLAFAEGIKKQKPCGVDVILNSLSGEALHRSWDCIAPLGRFVEIGKRDIQTGGKLDMQAFFNNVVFASVDLLILCKHRPKLIGELLDDVVKLWSAGKIRQPHPINKFSYSSIDRGLRSLQLGQSMGKIVCVPSDEQIPVLPEPETPFELDANGSYILAGGLGGLGRSIAYWMASRGGKHLIFLRRSHGLSPAAEEMISVLESMGCQCHVICCDISNEPRLAAVIKEIQENYPPIRGCINCSASWADSAFENMTYGEWRRPIKSKVNGSWNLHKLLPSKDLQFFVMLSSVAGVAGNRSQANYNAANTFQDALARYRVSQGLPGVTVDLGAVTSVGFMAENKEYTKHSMQIGNPVSEDQMLAIIDYVLNPQYMLTETTCQLICQLTMPPSFEQRATIAPRYLQYPMFSNLRGAISNTETQGGKEAQHQYHVQGLLAAARTEAEAADVVLNGIRAKLSAILGVSEDDIDPARSIQENGVDSLMEMEFRTWVSKDLGATMAKGDLNTKSATELSVKIAGASVFTHSKS
ncbi:iterative type I polyketide synthase [Aspergillus coremiiformis]|uniref:Iterative type I polyketide synthase n=1 Tax=Aspergillus coremiiformis TaxID=138285 RepID=A0A5N6ZCW8_9EURO|nr:iterative type I polyketide synthase [Aspergillus coremiiformis]